MSQLNFKKEDILAKVSTELMLFYKQIVTSDELAHSLDDIFNIYSITFNHIKKSSKQYKDYPEFPKIKINIIEIPDHSCKCHSEYSQKDNVLHVFLRLTNPEKPVGLSANSFIPLANNIGEYILSRAKSFVFGHYPSKNPYEFPDKISFSKEDLDWLHSIRIKENKITKELFLREDCK